MDNNSSLNASQDYLSENVTPSSNNGWMNKATSFFGNMDMNAIPSSIKQYGTTAADKVKSMSTTQKVVGGAIVAAGAWYLASKSKKGYGINLGSAAHSSRNDQ